MNANKLPFAQLMATLREAGADEIETITIEQVTQIHNASKLNDTVKSIVEEIKGAAENNVPSNHEEIVNLLSNIDIALTTLIGSLGANKTEVTKASNAKIVAANQPKTAAKKQNKKAEKQIDIEDEPAESDDKK